MPAKCMPSGVSDRFPFVPTFFTAPSFRRLKVAASIDFTLGGLKITRTVHESFFMGKGDLKGTSRIEESYSSKVLMNVPGPRSTPKNKRDNNVWSSAQRRISGSPCSGSLEYVFLEISL